MDVVLLILAVFAVANAVLSFFMAKEIFTLQEPPPAPYYGE